MSQWDKLLKRIFLLNEDVRFEELKRILERYGYQCHQPRSGSSHYSFRKQGAPTITIPKPHGGKPMKRVYVKAVRDVVQKEMRADEES